MYFVSFIENDYRYYVNYDIMSVFFVFTQDFKFFSPTQVTDNRVFGSSLLHCCNNNAHLFISPVSFQSVFGTASVDPLLDWNFSRFDAF